MRNFIVGILVGSALTGSLSLAGTFYDSKGQPNAPSGSIQQFDFFRSRQQFLDTAAIRRAQEEQLRQYPCAR